LINDKKSLPRVGTRAAVFAIYRLSGLISVPRSFVLKQSVFFFLLLTLLIGRADAAVYDVYILAGQSNMDGRGNADDLAEPLASPQAGTLIYYANPANPSRGDSTIRPGWQTLAPGFSIPPNRRGNPLPSGAFGPEISFASALRQANPSGHAIAIIKVSRGGTNLHTDWSPTGFMYQAMIQEVAAAIQLLADAGDSGTIRGMLWHQGESDASSNPNYRENLEELIANVRVAFDRPHLPFVIGELAQTKPQAFRHLQQTIAQENAGVEFAGSDDLNTTDGTHFDADGQVLLGQRYAQALATVPEPSSLCLLAFAGTVVLRPRHPLID